MLCSITGCSQTKYDSYYMNIFDTFSTFSCYADNETEFNKVNKELEQYLIDLNKKYDIYNDYDFANIKTINDNAGIKAVKVDSDIIELIKFGKDTYNITDGTVNIAMGSVLEIWHKYRTDAIDNNKVAVPSMEELKKAAEHTDINSIEIDENNSTVFIKDKLTRIDVGAIAKGFSADKAKDFLKSKGVTDALLNLGGNVIGINGENRKSWTTGVQNPDNDSDYITKYDLVNQSAVTSGNYQRYYEYEGKRYHHIIDGKTLMPADNNKSVSIVSDSSALCDALSTAIFILPYNEGVKLAEKNKVKVVWLTKDNEVKYFEK